MSSSQKEMSDDFTLVSDDTLPRSSPVHGTSVTKSGRSTVAQILKFNILTGPGMLR